MLGYLFIKGHTNNMKVRVTNQLVDLYYRCSHYIIIYSTNVNIFSTVIVYFTQFIAELKGITVLVNIPSQIYPKYVQWKEK
uniref:Uncharacterized protein n=1 Tax=Xenopus tropicalis TaxID=8364 RepID=A0A1B8XXV8_XENTR